MGPSKVRNDLAASHITATASAHLGEDLPDVVVVASVLVVLHLVAAGLAVTMAMREANTALTVP
ncbi:MAG: hypothetical protein NVSMB32_04610 [Actinomycetota bacterium]